ncbi:gamma-glutamylcyclotransferase [Catenovulum sp. 2E275]|uniref:gamma-glutamylcyclotransferase family protein n=1 Tax=Catenovulum sp. 2E275 TaxID=2980497 RepID=UPI0021D00129|nr:gamma-glutamylcyclotransferase family protein [Catenovulum sp. 2E275]MCU4674878.1 gamma-glutamylcyclotransferase [Catenovulum sp. 2E275]
MTNIFTYGSLMYAPVWQTIVAGNYHSEPACLDGFIRYGVKNEEYPVVKPNPQAQTQGLIYFNVNSQDLTRLDIFEGEYYQRQTKNLVLAKGETIQADCYILKPDYYDISDNLDWSIQKFEQVGLQNFLAKYNGFNAIQSQ